jgi:adenylate cyclase class 1
METNQIINRFEQLNHIRVERLSKLVSSHQQPFFQLLPFLLHTNIPELPGYGSKKTPVGIMDYQIDDKTVNEAQKLGRNFKYKRHAIRHFGLAGLCLVNEYGLLNVPDQLTFTVYIIHTDINSEQHQALIHKIKLITQWAKSLEITLNTKLLGQKSLATNPLKRAQLEQLYLNGLVLAGGIPIWWLVAPGKDYQHSVALISKQRTQTRRHLIDFGNFSAPTSQELTTASCQLLIESIDSGLTHLLTVLCNQSQLEQYPNNKSLSNEYKDAVYRGERDPLAIDPKVLQYKSIAASTLAANTKRLAQQSLYIQTQEPLSKHVSQPRFPWRRDFIKKTAAEWSWANHEFQILDRRDIAKYQQCLEEHQQTKTVFAQVQSTIKQFAKQHHLTLPLNNALIDDKQRNYADIKPNIITALPNDLLAKSPEEEIHLYHFSSHDGWKLSLVPLSSEIQNPLYHHNALLHVLCWAISNGLLNKSTRILIADKMNQMTVKTTVSLVQQLLRSPLNPDIAVDEKANLEPAKLNHLLLFANLNQSGKHATHSQGIQLTSLHNDPFNYANRGETLLHSVDALIHLTTGQWQTFQTDGKAAPLDLLVHLSSWWVNGKSTPAVSCWCPSDTHGPLISQRLSNLYMNVNAHYHKSTLGNYLILIADTLYQLSWQPESVDVIKLDNVPIEPTLTKLKTHFSVTKLDHELDPTQQLNTLLNCQRKDVLSLIVEQKKQTISIHILDEFGNLITSHNLKLSQQTALKHFQRFLSCIQKHKPNLLLRYFKLELTTLGTQQWELSPLPSPVPSISEKQGYLPVIITMASPKEDALCTINFGPNQFSGPANAKSMFEQTSSFILKLRKSNFPYPLYINEINFSEPEKATTLDYLQQKQHIEKQLNLD